MSEVPVVNVSFFEPGFNQDPYPVLEEIRSAKPNEFLKITGYTNLGSQWVLVDRVERSPPLLAPTVPLCVSWMATMPFSRLIWVTVPVIAC